MANILTRQSGNLTTTTTNPWQPVETGASATQTDKTSGNTDTTTSPVYSPAFTITNQHIIDGVLMYLQRKTATGTITVSISADGGTTDAASVTINATDIGSVNTEPGWVFFKFTAPVTSTGGTNYKIGIKGSSAGNATFFRSATTADWARLLRVTSTDNGSTTATATPASADNLYIHGELTGAGTGNTLTVTMDDANAGATVYGTIDIGKRGILLYGTTASTSYYLKIAGNLNVWNGGELDLATVGTPMPSTSSGVLEFNNASTTQFGLLINKGATFIGQGNTISFVSSKLTANFTANGTSITTADSTGWKNGDKIAIASTGRPGSSETTTLTADASGTTLTIGASTVTTDHSGTSPTQAEIINLTRNVKIRGISTVNSAYIFIDTTATVDLDYVEINNMGSGNSNKRGIDIQTTTGNCDIQYCGLYTFKSDGNCFIFNLTGASVNNITLGHNVSYDADQVHLIVPTTTGTAITIDHCIFMKNANGSIVSINDVGITYTNNTAISGNSGVLLTESAAVTGTFTGNTSHSCSGIGQRINNIQGITTGSIGTLTVWNNNSTGLQFNTIAKKILIDTVTAFGNNAINIQLSTSEDIYLVELRLANLTINAGTTNVATVGLELESVYQGKIIIDSSNFGVTTTHSSGDIQIATASVRVQMVLRNTKLNSSTPISSISNLRMGSYIAEEKYSNTSGNNRIQFAYDNGIVGKLERDASIFDVTPSIKITPASASLKCESTRFRAAVANGQSLTASIKVRESVVGDGVAYNGNKLRLILAANPAIGVSSDTVLATATGADVGSFETISGATPSANDNGVMEFFIDGDGTAGFFNIDTLSVS